MTTYETDLAQDVVAATPYTASTVDEQKVGLASGSIDKLGTSRKSN